MKTCGTCGSRSPEPPVDVIGEVLGLVGADIVAEGHHDVGRASHEHGAAGGGAAGGLACGGRHGMRAARQRPR